MGIVEMLAERAKKEGEKIGLEKGKALLVRNLLIDTDFSITKIASLADVSEAFVRRMRIEL